jgi:predicted N-formylglutamate amidohydrolase
MLFCPLRRSLIPVHEEQRGLPHLTLEIRQDLIADKFGQTAWAARLVRLPPLILVNESVRWA